VSAWTTRNGHPRGLGLDVLERIAAGADDCEIAADLGISRKTVAAHRARLDAQLEEQAAAKRAKAVASMRRVILRGRSYR